MYQSLIVNENLTDLDKYVCLLFFVSQINERGMLCRKSKDMCDFPEFCNGTSEFCVPDVQSANLEPCNNRSAFCLNGICRDPDRQCADLFGKCTGCIFFFLGFILSCNYFKVNNLFYSYTKMLF
jgi:hypothetical protein